MNRFEYKVYDIVYNDMISGKKKIEFRLLNDKSESIKIGDEIKFIVLGDESRYLLTEVTNKYIYDDIDTLWNSKDILNNILDYNKDELTKVFYDTFGKEKVINSKIVGIEFKLKNVNKPVRKAVRTYLIKDNQVVAIKYKENNLGYYDIPGGKIEDGETKEEASEREFKEETGIKIVKQHYIGHNKVEYPDKIFELDIFVVDEYIGEPLCFKENDSMWIDINDLKHELKVFPSIKVINYLKENINIKIKCDENSNILNIEKEII